MNFLQFVANTCLDAGVFLWIAFVAYLVQQALNKRRMPSSDVGKESK